MRPTDKPSAARFGRLRSALVRRGLKPAQVDAAVGKTVSSRTWGEITSELTAALRALPKGRG